MNSTNPRLPLRWTRLLRLSSIALAFAPCLSWAVTHSGYQVDSVRPGGDRPCTLFTLVGVSQSDPVAPGSSWFSIPQTTTGYKEMVATLLVAKAAGRTVDVITTGAVPAECGHPGVSVILLH